MPYPTVIQVTKNDSMTFREPPLSSLRCILCCVNVAHAAGVRPHQGERAADRRVLGWQRHPRCAHRRGDAAIKCVTVARLRLRVCVEHLLRLCEFELSSA